MLKTRRKGSGNGGGSGELKRLRARLAEAEETLEAIRKGEVDAITVEGPHGRQIFTLQSADLPYRTLVERMNEGAASMNGEGVILFCNERLAEMLGTRPEKLIGRSILGLVVPAEKEAMEQLLGRGLRDEARAEIQLQSDEGTIVPALVSLKATPGEVLEEAGVCLIATDLTERKQAEEISRAWRRRVESVLDRLPVMVCLLTPEHDVAFANQAFRKQFGECAGRKCYDYCFGKSEPCEFCEAFRVLKTNAPHDWELSKEGRQIHAFDLPFTDVDGSPLVLEMDLDVTEQRQAEAIACAERQKFRDILDNLPPYVVLLTPDYHVAFANREFRQRFGESHGRRCYEFLFGRSEPCEVCNTYEVLKTGGPVNWKWTGPDGRNYDIYDFPFTDTDGSRLILEMGIDVTEQRRAEEELRRGEARYRLLLESLPQKIAYKDRNSVYISCNENYARDLKMKPEEIAGHTDYDFFAKELAEKYRADDRSVMESGEPRLFEESYVQNGRGLWVNTVKAPVRDDAGKVTGVFVLFWDITERRHAEQKLREQAALLDLAHDAIFLRSLDGRISFWSRGASDTYGFSVEEAVGQISSDLLKTVFPTVLDEIQQRIATVREWEGELRHTRKDGTEVVVASRWSLLRDEEGGPAAIMEINRDVTGRKKAEEAARAAALYARNLIETSLDPLVTISSEGKITDVNRGTELVTGLSREELIGSDFSDYFTEPEKARQGYQQVFEQGTVRDYPLAIRDTAGQITDVLYNASVYKNEAGEVQGVFAAARDVTERKRFEEELRVGRERLALALKAGRSGTFEWEIQKNLNRWSPEIEELYGVPTGQFGGTYENWESLVLPEDLEIARAAIRESLASGDFNSEWRIRRQNDNEVRWMGARAKVLFDESGRPARMVGINTDVTERKRAEEALEEKAQELARSNEELAQFAYVASHDLQEPLRKIVAFGDRLVDHSSAVLDEQGRDYLERMQNAAKRMGQLIESLLELSRVTTKGAEFAAVDLNAVLSEVLTDLEVRIQQTQGRVEVGALPTVMADRSQMRQLFQNLIGNALKFHREDAPPVIQISGQQKRGAWEIHVTDNGIGFDEKYTERIFRPFQRLHGKNVFEGSGMGLAICNKIAARHAGEITAHSQPGRGSDFVLTLPTRSKTREARAI